MKKILVIDAQSHTQALFVEGLKADGFHAIGAENGRVGIHKAQEQLPNLIVCDIAIPELDGYGVLTTLRQNPATAVIPVIIVTDKTDWHDLRKAMELGANDYLIKPCTLEELLRAIAIQLEKQAALQHWYTAQSLSDPPSSNCSVPAIAPHSMFPATSQLSDVFRFIEANYHHSITLGDVARAVGYSPAYLTNLTRRQTGQTVQRWIIKRRMAAARSLLLETNQDITQIAAQIGYHHVVHFFRQFRQFHGTTPQAWRNAHRHYRKNG